MTGWMIAFVAGTWALQASSDLPRRAETATACIAAALLAAAAWVLIARRSGSALAAGPPPRASVAHAAAMTAALLLGGAAAAWRADLRLADALPFADEGRDLVVTGIVAGLPQSSEYGVRFVFEVEAAAADPPAQVPGRILLSFRDPPPDFAPAQRWQLPVRLRRPHGPMNPHGFDVEAWLFAEGLRATGTVRSGRRVPPPHLLAERVGDPGALVERARHRVREAMSRQVAGTAYGGALLALAVGDQRALPAADWALFNRTGVSHLISISGLHITMIAAAAALLAAGCWRIGPAAVRRVPRQVVAAWAAVAAALAYCLLAGWGVPAQRTFLMIATVAACRVARRRIGAARTLALAAAAVCAFDPWAPVAAGFWLSFGAVAGIFLATAGLRPPPAGLRGLPAVLRGAAGVQAAVTLALLPLTVVLFHQVSLISPLANAVAIPLVSYAVTPLALIGAALAVLPGAAGEAAGPVLQLAHALFASLVALLQWLDSWPAASVALAAPPPWLVVPALAGAAWCLAPGFPLRPVGLLWIVPLLAWPPERPRDGELWVTALDVGQGMALVVQAAGATVLYDTGPRWTADSDAGSRIVLPWLRSQGIDRLDAVIVSHLDADHSGGFRAIADGVRIERLATSIDPGAPVLRGHAATPCVAGDRLVLGPLVLSTIHPGPAAGTARARRPDTNARSCVIRAEAAGHAVLLPGDIPAREERAMVAREGAAGTSRLAVALLVAPHHGSRTSSTDELLQAAAPRWVAIQVGYRSRYGHPHAPVLDRYASHGLAVLRTDHHGALRWRFAADGAVRIDRHRIDHRRYWHNQPAPPVEADPPDRLAPRPAGLDAGALARDAGSTVSADPDAPPSGFAAEASGEVDGPVAPTQRVEAPEAPDLVPWQPELPWP